MTEMDTEETCLIRTEKLVKAYKGRKVVREVEINVKAGEIVGLLGPNGAGKTTSFYMIVGLIRPSGGKVYFNGKNITRVPMYKRARMAMIGGRDRTRKDPVPPSRTGGLGIDQFAEKVIPRVV